MSPTDPLFIFAGTVFTALTGAVGYLFRAFEHAKKLIETELKECQADRLKLWQRIADLEKEFKDCECEDHYKKKQ